MGTVHLFTLFSRNTWTSHPSCHSWFCSSYYPAGKKIHW